MLNDPVQDNLYLGNIIAKYFKVKRVIIFTWNNHAAFELLDLGPVVLDTPSENPMEEVQARIYFRDLLLGIEYRRPI